MDQIHLINLKDFLTINITFHNKDMVSMYGTVIFTVTITPVIVLVHSHLDYYSVIVLCNPIVGTLINSDAKLSVKCLGSSQPSSSWHTRCFFEEFDVSCCFASRQK